MAGPGDDSFTATAMAIISGDSAIRQGLDTAMSPIRFKVCRVAAMDELDMSMSGSPQTSLILGREVITWWKSGGDVYGAVEWEKGVDYFHCGCVPRADGAITRLDMFISVQACCGFSSCTIFR